MQRVLLIDHREQNASELRALLVAQGFDVVDVLNTSGNLAISAPDLGPDVVLATLQLPRRDVIEDIRSLLQVFPCPVAVYEGSKDAEVIGRVIDAGICAYVTEEIRNRDLAGLLQLASARFRKLRSMQEELQSARNKLEERKAVERAKVMLMRHHDLNEADAHQTVQQLAMNQRVSLHTAAARVIAMFESLPTPRPRPKTPSPQTG